MYSHLAVAVDFSDISTRLLEQIDEFRQFGICRLTLIHVREVGYPVTAPATSDDHFKERLASEAERLEEAGWDVNTVHVRGRPANQIVAAAEKVDADLIAVGNKGHGAVSEVLLGSVATEVLERAKRPVFLYCDDEEQTSPIVGDTVVYPTDFSESADDALSAIAGIGHPTVVLHVMDSGGSKKADIEEARRDELDERRRRLEEAGVSEVTTRFEFGRPRKIVTSMLDDHPGALCVMGTQGRGRLSDMVLGGVTRKVARRGTHHMLVVPAATD